MVFGWGVARLEGMPPSPPLGVRPKAPWPARPDDEGDAGAFFHGQGYSRGLGHILVILQVIAVTIDLEPCPSPNLAARPPGQTLVLSW